LRTRWLGPVVNRRYAAPDSSGGAAPIQGLGASFPGHDADISIVPRREEAAAFDPRAPG